MSESEEVSFIKSGRGGHIILYKHHLYRLRATNRGVNYFRCTQTTCKAKLKMKNGVFWKVSGEHTHAPNLKKLTKMIFYNKLKSRCLTETSEPVSEIYKEELLKFAQTAEIASCLPRLSTASQSMIRAKTLVGKKKGKSVSAVEQKNEATNSVIKEEVVIPDAEMHSSDSLEIEKSGSSQSLMSNSDILLKQEIIEIEEESSFFDDPSLHSSLVSDSCSKVNFKTQTPSTSYLTHSDSSNSNPDIPPVEQVHDDGTKEIGCDVSTNPREGSSKNFEKPSNLQALTSFLNVICPESSSGKKLFQHIVASPVKDLSRPSIFKVSNPESPSVKESIQYRPPPPLVNKSFPSTLNVTSSESSSSNGSVQSGDLFHKKPAALPQVLNNYRQQSSCINQSTQPIVPFHSSLPFPYRDKFDTFGEFIASKLRKLDPKSSLFAQTALADIIFKAELGMLLNGNETHATTRNNDVPRNIPSFNESESSFSSSKKENDPLKDPFQKENTDTADHEGSMRDQATQTRFLSHVANQSDPSFSSHLENQSDPRFSSHVVNQSDISRVADESISPVFNHSAPKCSLPNESIHYKNPSQIADSSIPPDTGSSLSNDSRAHLQNSCHPGLNVPVPGNTSNLTQTKVSSHIEPPSLSRVSSWTGVPIQSRVPFHGRHKDEFDTYGELVASKLRYLDIRSCAFAQKIFSEIIFEAEVGRFLSNSEKSIFANKTNDIIQNLHSVNESESNSLKDIITDLCTSYKTYTRSKPPEFCDSEVPLEFLAKLHSIYK